MGRKGDQDWPSIFGEATFASVTMESNEDTRFFRIRSPILCNFVDTSFILSILDACRGNLARSPMLKEIIPTCHSFQFFKDRSLNFLTVLDVDFSRVNSKTFETSFLERRNGTRIANKIGVTARVHSRFACSRGVHKAARSWPSITACYPQRQQIGPP